MIPSEVLIEEPEANGTWVADITTTQEPDGSFELGERTWVGSLTAQGAVSDGAQWHARIVGGRGKLNKVVQFKNYAASIVYAQIIRDIIADCGETAGDINVSKRATYYERGSVSAGRALTMVCEQAGVVWWVNRDGAVCAGSRAALEVDAQKAPQLRTSAGAAFLSVTTADDVSPGMTIGGRVVRSVRWTMASKLQAECSFSQVSIPDEAPHLDFARTYKAKVSRQNGDGSLDVIVDERYKVAGCELLSGLPGTRIAVNPGDSVAVGWYGGRPTSPYAWGLDQLASAAIALALVGDTVEIVLPPFTFVGLENAVTPVTGVMTAVLPKTLGTIVGPGSARTKSK